MEKLGEKSLQPGTLNLSIYKYTAGNQPRDFSASVSVC